MFLYVMQFFEFVAEQLNWGEAAVMEPDPAVVPAESEPTCIDIDAVPGFWDPWVWEAAAYVDGDFGDTGSSEYIEQDGYSWQHLPECQCYHCYPQAYDALEEAHPPPVINDASSSHLPLPAQGTVEPNFSSFSPLPSLSRPTRFSFLSPDSSTRPASANAKPKAPSLDLIRSSLVLSGKAPSLLQHFPVAAKAKAPPPALSLPPAKAPPPSLPKPSPPSP